MCLADDPIPFFRRHLLPGFPKKVREFSVCQSADRIRITAVTLGQVYPDLLLSPLIEKTLMKLLEECTIRAAP